MILPYRYLSFIHNTWDYCGAKGTLRAAITCSNQSVLMIVRQEFDILMAMY